MSKKKSDIQKFLMGFISIGVILIVLAFLATGPNTFTFEYEAAGGWAVVGWVLLIASAVWGFVLPYIEFFDKKPLHMITEETSKRQDTGSWVLKLIIYAALLILSFLCFGYLDTEFNNPY